MVNAKNKNNNTALMNASYKCHHFLLTVPAIDVNAKIHYNETALFCTSFNGHDEVEKFLLTVPRIDLDSRYH